MENQGLEKNPKELKKRLKKKINKAITEKNVEVQIMSLAGVLHEIVDLVFSKIK